MLARFIIDKAIFSNVFSLFNQTGEICASATFKVLVDAVIGLTFGGNVQAKKNDAVGFHFILIFEMVLPIDFVGLSMSLMAKSMASCINAFTFGFM